MRQYSLTERVTRGTVVDVLLGRDNATGDRVLIEASRPEIRMTPELIERLRFQSALHRKLAHPNLIRRTERFFSAERRQCWLSEAFHGESLRKRLRRGQPFTLDEVLQLGGSLCGAVGALHAQSFVHGAISPEYIFCDTERTPITAKLLDTSLALLRVRSDKLVTPARVLVRTEYLAPERVNGKRASVASDIYSLGVVLFELATRAPPFVGPDDHAVRRMHRSDPPPMLPAGYAELQPIVERCLTKDDDRRFASADALREALEAVRIGGERRTRVQPPSAETLEALRFGGQARTRVQQPSQAALEALRSPAAAPAARPPARVRDEIRRLAGEDGMASVSLRFRSKRLALSHARALGAALTLHVPAVAPSPVGSRLRLRIAVDDLADAFVLEGVIASVTPAATGLRAAYLVRFEGLDKASAVKFLAQCAARPPSMGTSLAQRYPVHRRCALRVGKGKRAAELHDISSTGAFVSTGSLEGIALGQVLIVQLAPRWLGLWGGWVSARVVWLGEKGQQRGVGLRFIAEDQESLEAIREVLARAQPAGSA